MAFAKNNTNAGGDNNTAGSSNNDNWKATGFLNIYLPARDGTRVKLGAIPLKTSKPREKELAEWLVEEPEHRCAVLLQKLEMEYASAEPSDSKGFDLS